MEMETVFELTGGIAVTSDAATASVPASDAEVRAFTSDAACELEARVEATEETDAAFTDTTIEAETAPTNAEAEAEVKAAAEVVAAQATRVATKAEPHMFPALSHTGTGVLVLPGDANPYGLPRCSHVVLVYRISSGGYAKHKPAYISKETCLLNFIAAAATFVARQPTLSVRFILVQDACSDALAAFVTCAVNSLLRKVKPAVTVDTYVTHFGSGAASFNFTLDALAALHTPRTTTAVYLVEDDYIHVKTAVGTVLGGLALAPYATGYDHPDKYVDGAHGGNPLISGGGEVTRVYRGAGTHWRGTNSTTMTFASTLDVLLTDAPTMRMFTATGAAPPDDLHMFLALGTTAGRLLVSPLPAVSTHGETAFLAPYVAWDRLGAQADEYVRVLRLNEEAEEEARASKADAIEVKIKAETEDGVKEVKEIKKVKDAREPAKEPTRKKHKKR